MKLLSSDYKLLSDIFRPYIEALPHDIKHSTVHRKLSIILNVLCIIIINVVI